MTLSEDLEKKVASIISQFEKTKRIEIDKPRWDQSTYWGRVRHFWVKTNPLNILYTDKELDYAKDIVTRYRNGENIANLDEDELWKQKYIYDSAFHPDTGEKTFILGRMSAQAPMNMLITGFMLTFYKTLPAILFWQWFNQSFNAMVNYCNRSGTEELGNSQIMKTYAAATSGAIFTARFPPVVGRLVPFTAIAAANAVNLPLSRQNEIKHGMKIMDANGVTLGYSSTTAKIGISQVVLSRILMAVPSMVTIPLFMNRLERSGFLKRYPRFPLPFQVAACGAILTFSTPFCCAIFPQISSISVSWLEPELQEKLKAMANPPTKVYYNKGL
ncbi:Sideroflexin-1 [Folsomia candida]|uniref:Sidoreflexin n=1 Tax=Folsomia candida TaxID=158441 RepID=A0A226ES05_FOLCA|nr:Sideroflexin-1 [Folsomia candida]